MKKILFMLTAVGVLASSCVQETALSPEQQTLQTKLVGDTSSEYEEGTILVKLTKDAQQQVGEGLLDLNSLIDGIKDASVSPLFATNPEKAHLAAQHGLDRWYSVLFDANADMNRIAEKLSANDAVQFIEYNTLIERVDSDVSVECLPSLATKASSSALAFNDPMLSKQWDMVNTGDKSISATAVEGADVGVKDAWQLTAGDPRVIVAIFDQGVAVGHPDLKENLWVNPGENSSVNGADDDGNGYVDDINGYNFAEGKGRPSAKYGADHGTHIAGTIAAVNNNGIGVSSIAGGTGNGDGVRIMSCQIFDGDGGKASKANVAKAFHYAADNGASVAQCSYGESNKNYASPAEYNAEFSVESDALAYFLDPDNSNCEALETNIAVFASGNYNKPASLFPGALDGVISVTAFGPDFLPGGYSNYGAGCDIAAPGGDIIEGNANAPCMILSTGYSSGGEFSYVYKYGTSMACPHVTGVVALGMSYALKLGKKFSKEDFISRLLTSANNIDALLTKSTMKLMVEGNKYVSVDVFPKKGKMGVGAVDAWKFLMALEGTPTYLTSPGETLKIDVVECVGETTGTCGYTLEISHATKDALGLDTWGVEIVNGTIKLICTKVGAGKIRFKSSIGGHQEIPGLDFYKEVSIVSRPSVAKNGGWL